MNEPALELTLVPLEAHDPDLPGAEALHREPSVARYIHLSEAYFSYVTETPEVVYYKIMAGQRLLGGIQAELEGDTLSLLVCVGEAYRRRGVAFSALRALLESLPETVQRAEAAVEAENLPSLRLFEKLGFRRCGWAEGTLTYRLTR